MLAVETTQWVIAIGSLGSALVAPALALGLKDWFFRPRLRLVLRHASDPEESSDRIVTKRLETAETAAFVRLRLDNRGRSTARNVGVRVLKVHRWDPESGGWIRSRPELDGRLLQPSNQLASEPDLVDVFPHSDRIVDLASVDYVRASEGKSPIFVEISHPWPPNEANILEPAMWLLELLVVGDTSGPSAHSSPSRSTGTGRNQRAPRSGITSSLTGRTQSHRDRRKTHHEVARHRSQTSRPTHRSELT